MNIRKAGSNEIDNFIQEHTGWGIRNEKLHKEYIFKDFGQAFGFMSEVALVAESSNHHPEWFNVYKKVVVDLTTHEADGISERDFTLAEKMDEIAQGRIR